MTIADPSSIEGRITRFKDDLVNLSPLNVIRKNIIYGDCFMLTDDLYFEIRSIIAEKYNIHPNDVLIVGSSKLGFSIAPHKRYRHFTDTSDIDIVIVSDVLFSRIWESVHSYWAYGGYWEDERDFKHYLFQGWIRPDKLPASRSFELANEWWEFFNALSASGKYASYKIRGALYKNWYFLEAYQLRSVTACVDELRLGSTR